MVLAMLAPLVVLLGLLFFNHRRFWLACAVAVAVEVIGGMALLALGSPTVGKPSWFFDLAAGLGVVLFVTCLAILVVGAVRARRAMAQAARV